MKTLADLTAPQQVTKRLLEKDVQEQCVAWACARGYWARKFSSISQRSVPDYLFARELKVTSPCWETYTLKIKFACEFKAPGKTSTEAQIEEQDAMRAAGWDVFECDNFERFKLWVLDYERRAQ
jgi:hypothetical protein